MTIRPSNMRNRKSSLLRKTGSSIGPPMGSIVWGLPILAKEDFADAERSYQQARKLSQTKPSSQLEANAEFGLASIRDQQGKWDESIPLAQRGAPILQNFAFMGLAAEASELIIRGEEGKGDTDQALQSANELLELARKWDNPASIEVAEESVGNILLGQEDFPAP